jgi:hypothetical protein
MPRINRQDLEGPQTSTPRWDYRSPSSAQHWAAASATRFPGFAFGVQLLVGPADGPGEESFELTVCSPEWLAVRCRSGELVNGLHHVIVGWDSYDERVLRDWLEARVRAVEAATWDGIASELRFLGGWEFESYRP